LDNVWAEFDVYDTGDRFFKAETRKFENIVPPPPQPSCTAIERKKNLPSNITKQQKRHSSLLCFALVRKGYSQSRKMSVRIMHDA
jgi:hypothetical protein